MKNNQISTNKLIPLLLGIVASLFILAPALILNNSDTTFTGLEVAFGHEFLSLGTWASGKIMFSLWVVLAFAIPLVAGMLPLFTKKCHFIAAILFAIAAVLLFMTPSLTTVTVSIGGIVTEIYIDWTLGIGVILAASISIVASLFSVMANSSKV